MSDINGLLGRLHTGNINVFNQVPKLHRDILNPPEFTPPFSPTPPLPKPYKPSYSRVLPEMNYPSNHFDKPVYFSTTPRQELTNKILSFNYILGMVHKNKYITLEAYNFYGDNISDIITLLTKMLKNIN